MKCSKLLADYITTVSRFHMLEVQIIATVTKYARLAYVHLTFHKTSSSTLRRVLTPRLRIISFSYELALRVTWANGKRKKEKVCFWPVSTKATIF